jgi:hypothetical protein
MGDKEDARRLNSELWKVADTALRGNANTYSILNSKKLILVS